MVRLPAAWHAGRLSDNPLLTLHFLPSSSAPWPVAQIDRYVGNVQWTAVSETVARVLQRYLPQRPIGVLHNGVDQVHWRQPRRTDRPLTIVSTMRLARRKRPMAMLPILEQIRCGVPSGVPLRAVLVGDGPGAAAVTKAVWRRGLVDCGEGGVREFAARVGLPRAHRLRNGGHLAAYLAQRAPVGVGIT
jgi:hypothetical protein